MKNSADLGGCYPPWPSASVDNTLLYLQNSSYPTQPHSIIANYYPTAPCRVQMMPETSTNIMRYLYSRGRFSAVDQSVSWICRVNCVPLRILLSRIPPSMNIRVICPHRQGCICYDLNLLLVQIVFEQVLLRWWESTNNMSCCPPYWILIHECIISASRKLGKSSLRT